MVRINELHTARPQHPFSAGATHQLPTTPATVTWTEFCRMIIIVTITIEIRPVFEGFAYMPYLGFGFNTINGTDLNHLMSKKEGKE